jgi:hypothetical protein
MAMIFFTHQRLALFARLAISSAFAFAAAFAFPSTARAAPDFSGIWSPDQGVLWAQAAAEGDRTPPFTPEYAAKYKEALDASAAGRPKADPPAQCLPPGVPRMMASPFPFEIVHGKNTIYLLHEYMSQIRRIFMNGSAPESIGIPAFNGRSIGKLEGDVLVIETSEVRGESVLDTTHLPHSDALRVVERIRLLSPDKLQDEITLIDPKAYVRPWKVTRTYTRKKGEQILEYVCEENNRNPILEDGSTGFIGSDGKPH